MLSVFPELLFLSPLAPLIIRVALGLLLAYATWHHVTQQSPKERVIGILAGVLAISLIVGAWTQPASIVATLLLLAALSAGSRILPKSTLLLAIAMALSLIVTGPGAFAIDLPL